MVLWTQLYLDSQGYPVEKNIIFQDNKSAILLESNGKRSSSKRANERERLNIRYFFVTDQVEKGIVNIVYCPTDKMVSDFMTKPVQGTKYKTFEREMITYRLTPACLV